MNISAPVKIILTIIIIGIIGGVFYLTMYQKQIAEISKLKGDIVAKNKQLEDIKEQVKQLPEKQRRLEELNAQINAETQVGLTKEDDKDFIPNYLEQIEELVLQIRIKTGDSSFDLTEVRPGAASVAAAAAPPPEQAAPAPGAPAPGATPAPGAGTGAAASAPPPPSALAGSPTRTFEMTMKGRYNTLIEFLNQLGDLKLKRLVTINRIGLSPEGEKAPGLPPVLNISIPVTAYLGTGGAGR